MRYRNNSRPLGTFENFYFDLRTKHKREIEHKAKRRRALGTALLLCFLILLVVIKSYPTNSNSKQIPKATGVATTTSNFVRTSLKKVKPIKVGLQIGHWKAGEHPEITALHKSTGGEANSVSELEVNLAVGENCSESAQVLRHHSRFVTCYYSP